MLNLKKLIASVSAVAVMLTSVATTTFAATYTDVAEDSVYYEAVESLGKLGIVTGYEDGTYKPEETVTRAEMAALIARIQGYEETAKAGANTIFTDVAAEHWASGYVAQATNQGIINGYGDGTFGPEDPVLYEQAIKMIMSTLGYAPYAINNGDYPTGYLAAASRYEVTKGVSNAVIGTGANRGTIAQLLANAIDTPLMAQSKWNTDGSVEYSIYDGTDNVYKTLMSENLGVVKLKGVVMANTVTDITADKDIDTTEAAEVEIDITGNFDTSNKDFEPVYNTNGVQIGYAHDGKFLVADSDAEAFLGQAVIFYVVENEDEDMYEILSIAADSTKNDVLSFGLDQFDYVDTTNKVIRYYKNETDKTSTKKSLDDSVFDASNPTVVYNGKGGQAVASVLGTSSSDTSAYVDGGAQSLYGGMITLIDNDGVTGYDVILVEVAATAVVDEVSDDTVAFKDAAVMADGTDISELVFDEDDETVVIEVTKDGEAVDYATLTEWDVLSILAADYKAGYIRAEVISNPVVGSITADFTSKTSSGGKGFRIDGNKYDVAEGAYEASNLAVGDGGTFYIDKYGKIAAFNEDSALATGVAGNYGFVTKAIVEDDPIDGQTVTLQLVTANGVEVFDLATSVKVKYAGGSDDTKKPADAVVDETPEKDAEDFIGTALKGKVIKYTKNSNGYINSITFADYNDKFETKTAPVANSIWDAENLKLGNKYFDEDATIFFVDMTGSDYDTDVCQIGAVTDLEDETPYTVVGLYADSKATDSNVVVILGGLTAVSPSASVAMITDVATGENEDGDEIYTISYLLNGEEATADTVGIADLTGNASYLDTTSGDVTIGDIVKIKVNSAGKITSLDAVWDFDEDITNRDTVAGYVTAGTDEFFAGGAVKAYKDTSKEVTFDIVDVNDIDQDGDKTETYEKSFKISKAENVYVIDNNGRNVEVRKGSASNYKYIKKFYEGTGTVNVEVGGVSKGTVTVGDLSAFEQYTDYVFVREYEDKVIDVVIVKGPEDVRVN